MRIPMFVAFGLKKIKIKNTFIIKISNFQFDIKDKVLEKLWKI